jgi:hypothetical protein
VLAVLLTALALGSASPQATEVRFTGAVEPVTWADLRFSYRAGCPVGPAQLRTVRVAYRDFGGRARIGRLVVARRHAPSLVRVFRTLWDARFPLRSVEPVSRYRGSDDASMAADNTSGFNCRRVEGTPRWSMHALGEAVDVNPAENPYVRGSHVSPPAGRAYLDRRLVRPGMAVAGGVLVRAFAAVGWRWGGTWGDYQHFSTTGG